MTRQGGVSIVSACTRVRVWGLGQAWLNHTAAIILGSAVAALPAQAQPFLPAQSGVTTLDSVQPLDAKSVEKGAPEPSALARRWTIEPAITTRVTGTDNARLERNAKRDVFVEVMPRIEWRSLGPGHRLNVMAGVDHVSYAKASYADRTDPVVHAALNAALVQDTFFLDAGAQVDRRSPTPFRSQADRVGVADKVRTQLLRLSPYVQLQPSAGWQASLRSDNNLIHRSGAVLDKGYSRNTQARLTREPLPLGMGLELGEQSLAYDNQAATLTLQNVLFDLAWALDPQVTVHALAGQERSKFAGDPASTPSTSQVDSDLGLRVRWAPLERSVLTLEARRRFFGNGYDVQWSHRSRFLALKLGLTREPWLQPDTVRLSGNLAEQFDSIYRSRGFDDAQRPALVRDTLAAYGLQDKLTDPVHVYLNRPQRVSAANVEMALIGRRSVAVLALYQRRLEQLQRTGEVSPVFALAGDSQQTGGQLAFTFRLTPMVALETAYRLDRTRGLGLDALRLTKEGLFSLGTALSLSPHTRLALGAQYHELDTTGSPASAASVSVSLWHRF